MSIAMAMVSVLCHFNIWEVSSASGNKMASSPSACQAAMNQGIYLTWEDQDAPKGPASVDPEGHYSRVLTGDMDSNA